VQFSDDNEESNLTLRNNESVIGERTFEGAFIDDSAYVKLLGAEKNIASGGQMVDGGFYSGFMWDFCVFAAYISSIDTMIGGSDCTLVD